MTLDDRLRRAYLSEYLSARRLREDARRAIKHADDRDAAAGRMERRYDLARDHAGRLLAMAGATVEVCERMRHVLRDGGR